MVNDIVTISHPLIRGCRNVNSVVYSRLMFSNCENPVTKRYAACMTRSQGANQLVIVASGS